MCKGFGMIICKSLKGYFIEPTQYGDISHRDILNRMDKVENESAYLRDFVRIECPDWTFTSFRFDEPRTLPGWVEENREEIIDLVKKTLVKAFKLYREFRTTMEDLDINYGKSLDEENERTKKELESVMKVFNREVQLIPLAEANQHKITATNKCMDKHWKTSAGIAKTWIATKKNTYEKMVSELSKISGYLSPSQA